MVLVSRLLHLATVSDKILQSFLRHINAYFNPENNDGHIRRDTGISTNS